MEPGQETAPFPVTGLLFDLDDTLYDVPAMKAQVATNIQRYMVAKLGVPEDDVVELCFRCYMDYGTTLSGLVAQGHRIDTEDWHAFVHHTLPYEEYLRPDPALRRMLSDIRHPMHIFTNADRKHALHCLELLGVADLFRSVVSFEEVQAAAAARGWVRHGRPIVCKPAHQAYELALELTGLDPARTVWFDDSARNIAAGKRAGMHSVLVGRTGVEGTGADCQIESIHDLPRAAPWLFARSRACTCEGAAPCRCGLEAKDAVAGAAREVAVSCAT